MKKMKIYRIILFGLREFGHMDTKLYTFILRLQDREHLKYEANWILVNGKEYRIG
jgi:hypothetical protein